MKLATVLSGDRKIIAAVLPDTRVVELAPALRLSGGTDALAAAAERGDMLALIQAGAMPELVQEQLTSLPALPGETLTWLPPLERPGKICCVAINNSAFDEARISGPDHPAFFLKSPSSLIGHGGEIVIKDHYGLTHPEPELAVVIGKALKEASPTEALSGVFGFTILNDITSIRMRNEDHFHFNFEVPDGQGGFKTIEQHTSYAGRYKSADTFGPMGPVISTPEEIDNPDSLAMRCWLDDELVMSDNSASYRYKTADVLSFISHYESLYPGDIVTLGTAVRGDSETRPLSSLDLRQDVETVTIEIEGIGTLTNLVGIRS